MAVSIGGGGGEGGRGDANDGSAGTPLAVGSDAPGNHQCALRGFCFLELMPRAARSRFLSWV